MLNTATHEIGHLIAKWSDLENNKVNLMYYSDEGGSAVQFNQQLTIKGDYEYQWNKAHE